MKFVKFLMAWILSVLPLAVKVLQGEGQIQEKTVNETSTELVPYYKYESIPEITDTKSTSDSSLLVLIPESGDSLF